MVSAFDEAVFQVERWSEAEDYAAQHGGPHVHAHYDAFVRLMRSVDTPAGLRAWRKQQWLAGTPGHAPPSEPRSSAPAR